MRRFFGSARSAVAAGAAAALLAAGVVAGAAGDYFIIGATNDSGTSQSILLNAGTGAAFTLKTTNVSTNAAGIFGWSSSTAANATRGVYGRADGPNSYGVYARQGGTEGGNGAALYADGLENQAIIATSNEDTAITGTALGCTGLFCGSNGVTGTGAGFAAGVFGDGTDSIAGVWGSGDVGLFGVFGVGADATGIGVYGSNSLGNAVVGDGEGAGSFTNCDGFYCAGGVFRGDNGVMASSETFGGYGVYGEATGSFGIAVYADGDALVSGDLTVNGTCTGCTTATLAQNGGSSTIRQGDAVTLTGVTTSATGQVVLVVDLARKGDAVLGIADRAMAPAPKSVSIKATERKLETKYGTRTTKVPARTEQNQAAGRLVLGGTSAAKGSYLRVITAGVYAYKAAAIDASVGAALAVGDTRGKLAKAGAETAKGAVAGRYLGTLKDGRIVLLVEND
jgi:hypothetical protein